MKPIPNRNEDEEEYLDRVLECADEILNSRGENAGDAYVTIEANTAVYLITRYRALSNGGGPN